ncbi:MAG: deoxyribodipyrimidine photolyase [Gammaproteobacteria bacterium]|nr:MAG: deoxyribodipyrimidine photolyase [Pseudomonadota bacterium]PIE38464.1 MAG: deoxyribodipyrimidine photolyase [Gammaproteobacteria bacterium]
MWFRSDLRVRDNPALMAAMAAGPVVGVYFLCEQQWDSHQVSLVKRSLIIRQLNALSDSLAALHVPLVVLNAGVFQRIPGLMTDYVKRVNCHHVFCNHEYEVNEADLTCLVRQALASAGHSLIASNDQCLVEPGQIQNRSGEPYKVFSAFRRAFYRSADYRIRPLHFQPARQSEVAGQSGMAGQSETGSITDLSPLKRVRLCSSVDDLWPAGEDYAHERLNRFVDEQATCYAEQRDIPSLDATSALSPYLATGIISTRQCLHAAVSMNQGRLTGGNKGIDAWINELLWREFYRHLLFFFPQLCKGKPFRPETDQLPWSRDEAILHRWASGRTGYPIVDAAMRQLTETGWMHNRLRMVTAMFLTKDLFVDWRLGEQFFMSHLIDGDLASNNGGWQWSASTGVDAVPYFRVFNPYRQSERFDPRGEFIRKYLPELRHLDDKSIHRPSEGQANSAGYDLPIVEHGEAVKRVKACFSR